MIIKEVWADTGVEIEREATDAELEQRAKDDAKEQALKDEAEQLKVDRQALLNRLGITAEEAKLLAI